MTVTGRMRKTTGRSIAISAPSLLHEGGQGTFPLVARLVVQNGGQGRSSLDRGREGAAEPSQGGRIRALNELRQGAHGGRTVADVRRRESQLGSERPTRTPRNPLDCRGDRFPSCDGKSEKLRAVRYRRVNRPLAPACLDRQRPIHRRHCEQGGDEGACAQGNE